jgi:short-subunit dehydrogenase
VDVWINNAGTTMFAHLDEGDFADHRRVIETNLLAPMYAARLLIPVFRRQNAGTLINVGSVLSEVGQPFVPSYVISKFGLHGLSEAVRTEFAETPAVAVCTVLPYATDTPHFEDGANFTGRQARAMPPAQSPEVVAAAILDLAARPRRQRYVPRYMALGVLLHWMWPEFTERVLRRALQRFHLVGRQAATRGNLSEPVPRRGSVRGSRPPLIGVAGLAVWVAADLLRQGFHGMAARDRRWPVQQSTR